MPAPSDEARRSAASWALTAMIHGRRAPGARRISRVASTPSRPGHLEVHQDHVVEAVAPRLDDRGAVGDRADAVAEALQQALGDLAVDRIVVGDQDLQRPVGAAGAGSRRADFRRRRGAQRHLQREGRAFAGHAGAADPAAHQVGQPRADGQAQAGAAVAARHRRVAELERLEDLRHAIGLDADAGVADVDAQHRHGAAAVGDERPQPHLAHRGELDGVAEQVVDDLRQPRAVAEQPVRDVVGDAAWIRTGRSPTAARAASTAAARPAAGRRTAPPR